MGSQLSAIAPNQILPAENYLVDWNNRSPKQIEFNGSLGSTRLFKTANCTLDHVQFVVKIFVFQGSNLPSKEHVKKIKDIYSNLSSAANCLAFTNVDLSEKAAFIFRPYLKNSLYDRISTRPFLSSIEKKWFAYQLLCALKQCHHKKVCHGDIKLENIMITSWSSLQLTDFASFKPVLLPEDNPTDFTYFFDTSRRRVCHIAPERFIKTIHEEELLPKVFSEDAQLQHSMDMFSVGCVLIELLTEGLYPFNLMQLLQYRSDSYYPTIVLEKITDERARNMVEEMIRKNPAERRSASEYLEQEKGKYFPEYFYSFLDPFFTQFVCSQILSADERIHKIYDSQQDIITALGIQERSQYRETLTNQSSDTSASQEFVNESLIIIISLITSSVRSLQFSSTKLLSLDLFKEFSKYAANDVILDRILPYICNFLRDPEPRVRAESLFALTHCLRMVDAVPRSETNIFLEYIFPHLNEMSSEKSEIVLQAEAANIAYIADTALRFLNYCIGHVPNFSPENEIEILQDVIQQKLGKYFSDTSHIVKRTLIENTLNMLCLFFGKEKSNDTLFCHLISLLNEKKDFHLRLSFYKNITSIASFMGTSCHKFLLPLFLQGLSDTEETVISYAVDNMSVLTELGIFPDDILYTLVKHTVPLLLHPNIWIRQAVVGLICTVSKSIEFIDVLTIISSIVKPFIKRSLLQFDEYVSVLSAIKDPLDRRVYDTLVKSSDIQVVFSVLKEVSIKHSQPRQTPNPQGDEVKVKGILKRLLANGLTDAMFGHIFLMEDHIIKINHHKKALEPLQSSSDSQQLGIINIDIKEDQQNLLHSYQISNSDSSIDLFSNISSSQSLLKSSSTTMNEEWQTMFGNVVLGDDQRSNSNILGSSRQQSSSQGVLSSEGFMFDQSSRNDMPRNIPSCQRDLERLLTKKKEEFHLSSQVQGRKAVVSGSSNGLPSSGRWKPKGHLVAHLHEHRGAVTRLAPLSGTHFYASSSKDGTVKIWDCNKIERTFPVNRSKATFNQQKGVIVSMDYCMIHDSIASASDNRSIYVVKVDKQSVLTSRHLSPEDGYALDMNYMDAGSHSLLTYSTCYGKIVGWDLRSPGNAWVLDNGVKKGVISSYAIDRNNNWLACGTTSGYVVCWDLRFMLPVSQVRHLNQIPVQKVKLHPTKPSWVITAMRSNNEVAFWNMESQSREKTLWASPNPPFSDKPSRTSSGPVLDNWFHSMHVGRTESDGTYLITVGTDSRIRYWDLDFPTMSWMINSPENYNMKYAYSYGSQVIDGTEVVLEKANPVQNEASSEESTSKTPDQPPTSHVETITDVIVVNQPQPMIVTSGFDGSLKMWK